MPLADTLARPAVSGSACACCEAHPRQPALQRVQAALCTLAKCLDLTRQVDTELVYAYAKTGDLGALEEFISGAQQANLQARTRSRTLPCMYLREHRHAVNNRLANITWFMRLHGVGQRQQERR